MDRNVWADRFADCVVRRSEWDAILGTVTVLLTLVIPIGLAIVIVTYLFFIGDDALDDWSITVAIEIGMVAECAVGSYILYSMTRRAHSHLTRDLEWMDSLIGYAESYGADASKLREIRGRTAKGAWKARYMVSRVLLAVNILLLMGVIVYMGLRDSPMSDPVLLEVGAAYIVVMIQFIFTVGATSGFPSKHDALQREFTEELSSRMRPAGLMVEPMPRTVPRRHRVVRALLFIVTLGLYSIPLLLWTNRHMNRHIRAQWEYEDGLLDDVIRFEGGTGIEGVGCNQPEGSLRRFLKNIMRCLVHFIRLEQNRGIPTE